MIQTYARTIYFQYMVLKEALHQFRNDEEGVTTIEILVIAAGLVALATAAAWALGSIATKKAGQINSPSFTISISG